MSETKKYTGTDIERYHRGELSAAEMHDLEAAALADPFLADAMEGYVFTKTPVADLAALQQRLQKRIDEKKDRKGIFGMSTTWMRVAALFIVVAGGGWLTLKLMNNSKEDIAVSPKALPQIASTPMPDSTAVVYNNPPAVLPRSKEEEQERTLATPFQSNGNAAASDRRSSSPAISADSADDAIAAEVEAANERLDGYASAAPTMRSEEKAAFSRQAKTDSLNNLNVVLKPNNLPVDQVTVSKNKRATAYDVRKRGNVVIDTLEPAEGWTKFDDYVASNIQEPEEFKDKPAQGEVVLSFDVNEEGEAVNIAVVKSLCEKCDKEAIRLLKEGPKWKKATKKGRIKIAF